MVEITLSPGDPLAFHQASLKKLRGNRLPGSQLYRVEREDFLARIQEYASPEFQISHRVFQFTAPCAFWSREDTGGLRLEIVLSGKLPIKLPNGQTLLLRAGQYHITGEPLYQSQYDEPGHCELVTIHYPIALLQSMEMDTRFVACPSRTFAGPLNDLLFQALQNPYTDGLLHFFYDTVIRRMVLLHLSIKPPPLPGGLSETEIAAIHAADNIIASHLDTHFSIIKLSRLVGLNENTLKKGFRLIFGDGQGPWERLLKRRMEVAVNMLETSDKPIKEISLLAGYRSEAGFITGFRRRFNITPEVWRERSRGGGNR